MANFPDIGVARKFNPRNINHMPAVQFFVRLDFHPIGDSAHPFLDGHYRAISVRPGTAYRCLGSKARQNAKIQLEVALF
jgi:hypothetical protein